MQAIILAAGMGKRLGALTKNNTKCMVKVNGISLIDRMLTQLAELRINKVIIVVGYKGKELKEYIGNRFLDRLTINYITNPVYDKTNNIYSLALAKDELVKDDTILLESDLIFKEGMLDLLVNHRDKDLVLVAKYESWMDGTMVQMDTERNILNFVPKKAFRYEDISTYYKTVNIYKFSKEFSNSEYVPFLEAYSKAMGNNEYYEEVLRIISFLDKSNLKALPIGSRKWYEIDDIQDLDIASTIFSDGTVKYQEYHKRYGGYWRFPELLDFCYLVNPLFPTQKLKDELKSNFDTLLTEYPSGMFINSLLAGKYFGINQNYICVGNGASELIKCVMEHHVNHKIGVIYPTFEEYPNRLVKEQIVAFLPNNKNFTYSVSDLKKFYQDKGISLLLLINPDNPSGNFIPKADVLLLAEWAKNLNIDLLVDESFVDFADEFATSSLLHDEILQNHTNLMVMKSISKSYGVPGLRLGIFATANEALIKQMKKEVAIWNINSFAEYYLQIFGKYENDYKKACEQFPIIRKKMFHSLSKIPYLRAIPSQANFILCEVIHTYTASRLTMLLSMRNDIFIKDCTNKLGFNRSNYIRVAIRDMQDNNNLIEALNALGIKNKFYGN
jgi:histidinol-phosphate/aromatic aminotransferase/cobyric acid decarboxylase-like protein/choline kinase